MRHRRLTARMGPWVRSIGPYGWIVAGLLAGTWLAREYLRRTRVTQSALADRAALAQWETDGGVADVR